ncbi:MAG: hypothetical protein EBQ66_01805 [Flavobacteriia bacterium]|nr:hypothetical protein [Flavobacteriia bacterium]
MLTAYLGIAIVLTVLILLYIYSGQTFNIYLIIYVIGAISVITGGTLTAFNGNKILAAILFFIGAVAIFVVFGLKWFSPGSVFAKTPVSWPPTINTCPDYLVYYGRANADGTKENTCIDLVGVSKNGGLKVFSKEVLQGVGNPPAENEFYFSLKTESSDNDAKKQELCTRAIQAGLTWEGVTNGESCTSATGASVAPGSGTANCPSSLTLPTSPTA